MFQLNQNNVEVKNILERSKTFLYENYNLKILRNDKYDGRLGWILCNLGNFWRILIMNDDVDILEFAIFHWIYNKSPNLPGCSE